VPRSSDGVDVHAPRSIRVTASRRCCPPNISSITADHDDSCELLHVREAGSPINLPVTHEEDIVHAGIPAWARPRADCRAEPRR
jgi:hypothetical protein